MKRGFDMTVQKISGGSARLAAWPPPARRGSLNNSSTAKNMSEHAERRHAKYIFHLHVLVHPRSNIGPGRAPDIYQRVVNRVADGANIFLRGACGRAHHARFYQRDAQSGEHQDEGHEHDQRHRIADRAPARERPASRAGNTSSSESGRPTKESGENRGGRRPSRRIPPGTRPGLRTTRSGCWSAPCGNSRSHADSAPEKRRRA